MDKNVTIPMRIAQKKTGNNWIDTYTDKSPDTVYRSLASDVITKKINQAKYIKSIKRIQKYDHVEITVLYDNNTRSIYFVSTHTF